MTASVPPRRPACSALWRWARVALSLGLLAFLLTQIDRGDALTVIAGAHPLHLALMLALILLQRLVVAYRWYILLHGKNPAVSLGGVVRLVFVSGFLDFFMPGGVGVEAVRVYGLARTTSDTALAFASVLVDRVLALFALVLLVLVGVPLLPTELPPAIEHLAWLGSAALVAGTAALMAPGPRRLTLLLLPGRWLAPVRGGLGKLYAVLDGYRDRPGLMLWSLVVAVLFQLLRCAAVAAGAAALGVPLAFVYFVVILPVIVLATLAPISIGGLGVQEVGFVYLFGLPHARRGGAGAVAARPRLPAAGGRAGGLVLRPARRQRLTHTRRAGDVRNRTPTHAVGGGNGFSARMAGAGEGNRTLDT